MNRIILRNDFSCDRIVGIKRFANGLGIFIVSLGKISKGLASLCVVVVGSCYPTRFLVVATNKLMPTDLAFITLSTRLVAMFFDVVRAALRTLFLDIKNWERVLSYPSQKVLILGFIDSLYAQISESGMGEFSWQARFHDHVIRNEKDLERVRRYINENPATWLMGEDESQTRIWG